jgi:general secretion pathway protein N
LKSSKPPPRRRPRRLALLIFIGLSALVVFVLATLPAGVVMGRLEGHGITADAVGGTIWAGRVQGLVARGTHVGDLQWALRPLELVRGTLAGHAIVVGTDGRVETDFARAWSGPLELKDARADLSLASLAALGVPAVRNWRGRIAVELPSLTLERDWPVAAVGTIDVIDLTGAPPRNTSLGDFRVTFPPSPTSSEDLTGTVTQTDGPLLLDGELTLRRDRSFSLQGRLAPRGTPPRDLAYVLQALGPADASGRRRFAASGTF